MLEYLSIIYMAALSSNVVLRTTIVLTWFRYFYRFYQFNPNGISDFINWTSTFPFLGLLGGIFHFVTNLIEHSVGKHRRP